MTIVDSAPVSAPPRSNRPSVSGIWAMNRDVLGNAGALIGSAAITSVLGVAYWAVAARMLSREAVGLASAAVSAMTLCGTIGMLGLGTLLISELPRRAARRGDLVLAAVLASGVASMVLGVAFAVGAPVVSHRFVHVAGWFAPALLFCLGVALTGATLVLDQATIGLLHGSLQLWRNLSFAVLKIGALVGIALGIHDHYGVSITASWVAGALLSLVPMAWLSRRKGFRLAYTPDWMGLRALWRSAFGHNALNLSLQVPRLLIPVLVVTILSANANAAFYVAWMLANFLYIVPTYLSTALFAVASGNPAAMARKIRVTLGVSLGVGIAGMVTLFLGANLALSIFGSKYAADAALPLRLLVLGYLPTVVKVHYIGVARATGAVPRASALMTTSALLEVVAAVVGARSAGLAGLCLALVAAFVLEALVTAPKVWQSAEFRLRRQRGQRTASTATGLPTQREEETAPADRHHVELQSSMSVVIAAFSDERWPDTIRAVRSAQAQSCRIVEVILVIDHNPHLYQRARRELPEVIVIENSEPRGASGARNSGVHASRGDLVAFLDDDAVASIDWLERSLPHFISPRVVGVGGRITPLWESHTPEWFPDEFLWAVGATYRGMPLASSPIRNVWAGNMVVRRAAFDKAVGFRADFGKKGDREDFQAEDTDFCLRVAHAWPEGVWMYEPLAHAAHKVPVRRSSWRFLVMRCFHEGRNKVLLSALVGSDGMTRERHHAMRTLPRGVVRGLAETLRGDVNGLLRSATIVIGLGAAALGVIAGHAHRLHLEGGASRVDVDVSGREPCSGDTLLAPSTIGGSMLEGEEHQ